MQDYWFPEVRTLPGAILVLSAVLYPYVYLSARASFVQQSICVLEVARTLGRTSAGAFWSVALPLARPALAAGVALALMECLNDLGAVQYLGVSDADGQHLRHLAAALEPGRRGADRAGGAAVRAGAAAWPSGPRAGAASSITPPGRYRSIPFSDLEGWRGYAAAAFCCLPVLAGFVAPFAVLLVQASAHVSDALRQPASGARRATASASPRVAAVVDRAASAWRSPTRAGWRPTPSCARRCGRRASATPCPAPCWRSAC